MRGREISYTAGYVIVYPEVYDVYMVLEFMRNLIYTLPMGNGIISFQV